MDNIIYRRFKNRALPQVVGALSSKAMSSWARQYQQLTTFLQSHGAVVTQKSRGAAGAGELRAWDALHPTLKLPEDYRLFLSLSNGLDIRWTIRAETASSSGSSSSISSSSSSSSSSRRVGAGVARVTGDGAGKLRLHSISELAAIIIEDPSSLEAFDDTDAQASSCTAASNSGGTGSSGTGGASAEGAGAGASGEGGAASSTPTLPLPLRAIQIDAGDEGVAALVYRPSLGAYQVWFQDLACMWHFAADSFTNYARLMVMHVGVLHWRYIFAPVGLDPTTAQWMRWLVPERFAVDDAWRSEKLARSDVRRALS